MIKNDISTCWYKAKIRHKNDHLKSSCKIMSYVNSKKWRLQEFLQANFDPFLQKSRDLKAFRQPAG